MIKSNINNIINIDILFSLTLWSCSGSAEFCSELRDTTRAASTQRCAAGIRFAQRIIGAHGGQGAFGCKLWRFYVHCSTDSDQNINDNPGRQWRHATGESTYRLSPNFLGLAGFSWCFSPVSLWIFLDLRSAWNVDVVHVFCFAMFYDFMRGVFYTMQLTDFLPPFSRVQLLQLPISQFQQLLHLKQFFEQFLVSVMASRLAFLMPKGWSN